MLTSGQILVLAIFGLIFSYVIIDRICNCIENSRNPMKNFKEFMEMIQDVVNNGNKSL